MRTLYLSIGVLFITICTSYAQGLINICKTNYITLPFPQEQGIVGVTSGTGPTENGPCLIRIKGCSNCHISIHNMNNWFLPCSTLAPRSLKECTPDCSYLFVFDSSYLNDSVKFYRENGWHFKSVSSAVFVGLCSQQAPPNISLQFNVNANSEILTNRTGQIRSPNFPSGYIQNGDQYTWIIRNPEYSRILVIFDDWHISPYSEVFFDNSLRRLPVDGSSDRSAVLSKGPEMKIIFNTGHHLLEDQNRYLGFRFTYTFYRDGDSITVPRSNCGKYDLLGQGGIIDFQMINSIKDVEYDCVWVIKKQPDFDRMYMKIISFRTDTLISYAKQEVEIRDGLTSDSQLKDKVFPNRAYPSFNDTDKGFYIRYRGTLRPMDNLKIVYASYRERGPTDCGRRGMFYCNNGRCIPAELECDRYNHCGDNSDELNSKCLSGGSGYSRSTNYTMTVSVIVPLVISVFLLVILCVLFFLIRRCHIARAREMDRESGIPTISGGISNRRGRRGRQAQRPVDFPPTYEEALESPPYEEPPLEYENGVLKPPTYNEAVGQTVEAPQEEYIEEDYPPPEFSTIERQQPNFEAQTSTSPPAESGEIRPVNHTYSMSYSSESSTDLPLNRSVPKVHSSSYSEVPNRGSRTSNRERSEHEYTERVPSRSKDGRQIEGRSFHPQRQKSDNDVRENSERKPYDHQSDRIQYRKETSLHMQGLEPGRKGDISSTARGNFSGSPSRQKPNQYLDSSKNQPNFKEEKYHKNEDLRERKQTKLKEDRKNRASDSSSKGLLFSEDHFTDREHRGVLNQGFKDSDDRSKDSPPRTNSASLSNLHPIERWTEDRRGMATSLQHLPTTQCVASRSSLTLGNSDHPTGGMASSQSNTRQEDGISKPCPLEKDRPISLSVGNLPIHSHLNPGETGNQRLPDNSYRRSLGDLNQHLNNQISRRQTQSHADLSNIQEERHISLACDSEDVFV
ncbi:uncharacterized protein LOC133197790 [Saccostrea echinata]|uniref:uncharacterized protein LOC133197790 n=1 Tax=Saccostrea echinata TaxID=191078 RepID=UPI002A7F8164|nr:uncharacterized protein LOC133197790 [Saccostrea echinata]